MALVFKICDRGAWEAAAREGLYRGSADDLRDGFVHLSLAHQVTGTLARHFAGRTDLVVVAFDPADLGAALRLEPSRGGELFPHLHGPLPTALVRWVRPVTWDEPPGDPYAQRVRAFHHATGAAVDQPFSLELLGLRGAVLDEEVSELLQELEAAAADLREGGVVSAATRARLLKELADVQYVLSGLAVTFGLPAEEAFARVHVSNLSKLGDDGRPALRADGKVLKGPRYRPPTLDDL